MIVFNFLLRHRRVCFDLNNSITRDARTCPNLNHVLAKPAARIYFDRHFDLLRVNHFKIDNAKPFVIEKNLFRVFQPQSNKSQLVLGTSLNTTRKNLRQDGQ